MNSVAWKTLEGLSPTQRREELAARAKVEAAASDFEAVWLERMMAAQRLTVGDNDLFGGGRGEEIFQAQLDGEYAKLAAQRGGGVSGMVRESMIRALNGYAARKACGGAP